MSRIGKLPISIPSGVTVTVDGRSVTVKGPKGDLTQAFHPHVHLARAGETIHVTVDQPTVKEDRALWGLSRVLLSNMITGVTQGFLKALEVQGVGYRVSVKGRMVVLALGFSHPIEYSLPAGIEAKVEGNVLTVTGIDKQLVGETAAQIRAYRKPEPYKGKGIRYVGETVRRKAGKVMKSAE
ncbi:MAG: 50S ribosomal protein L6 [Candidatus Kerfeldbacteria bacterium]|nr:50S ribosomal protein L6 [Candidatus Kerfeldbacteria bacterium]